MLLHLEVHVIDVPCTSFVSPVHLLHDKVPVRVVRMALTAKKQVAQHHAEVATFL